ncbi:hypothetical protein ACFY64_15460 [Streptomyces collinus]|uniref:hypothetical protein n=1 Tax=Streptomyces collinus TaxID=42684 RepID=UPI0036B35FDF
MGSRGGITRREFFSEKIDDDCSGESAGLLLMFAAAGEFKSEAAEDTVLFWAETGGNLREADADGWLAVLSVGKNGARFVSERDLTGTVAALRPVESRFFDMIERLSEEEEGDSESGHDFHTDTPRDPAFVDPSVLAE